MTSEQSKQAFCPTVSPTITIKIADEIARIKGTAEWKSSDRQAVGLIKNAPLNVMLMVLKKGAHLHEHRTKGPIVVQVLSGAIRFTAGTERLISAGEMVGLERNVAHSVEAL